MICPECQASGGRSEVRYVPMSEVRTTLPVDRFFDADGDSHTHDPNTYTASYTCSEGHVFEVHGAGACHRCDWSAGAAP